MVEDFDPSTIEDEGLRKIVMYLMNMVENLSAKVAEQAEEIQRLRDENNRREAGNRASPRSSQTKRQRLSYRRRNVRESKPRQKASKQALIKIDRVEVVKVDPNVCLKMLSSKGMRTSWCRTMDQSRPRMELFTSPRYLNSCIYVARVDRAQPGLKRG